jgi:hypothetical protein
MVLPICFVNIPSLPWSVINHNGSPVRAAVAYSPSNTNYFGATSCGLSSCQFPGPSSSNHS